MQQAVGSFGSRYTRLALIDPAPQTTKAAVFHSSRAGTRLFARSWSSVWGSATAPPATTLDSSSTLKVMTYNTHHGVGTEAAMILNRIATVIANQRPDIVSLNEVMYNSSYGTARISRHLQVAAPAEDRSDVVFGLRAHGRQLEQHELGRR